MDVRKYKKLADFIGGIPLLPGGHSLLTKEYPILPEPSRFPEPIYRTEASADPNSTGSSPFPIPSGFCQHCGHRLLTDEEKLEALDAPEDR